MSDFDDLPGMLTPPQQQELVTGDLRKGQCRYCTAWNLPDGSDRPSQYDCCDPSPPMMPPLSELSPAGQARRRQTLAELAAEAEAFEARMAVLSASTASAEAPRLQSRPWMRPNSQIANS